MTPGPKRGGVGRFWDWRREFEAKGKEPSIVHEKPKTIQPPIESRDHPWRRALMMTGSEVKKHFEGRAEEYARKAAAARSSALSGDGCYPGFWEIAKAGWWLVEMFGRPFFVCDMGCGAGTWARFWMTVMAANTYLGLDSSEPAIGTAGRIWKGWTAMNFKVHDLVLDNLPAADLFFAHGVLMHLPPADVWRLAAKLRSEKKIVMLAEKVKWVGPELERKPPHVWIHDYRALFGDPVYRAPMNDHKDIFIFQA